MPDRAQPTVIVLAAGRGQRFARSGSTLHKLDALLDGVTVLERVLSTVAASGLPWHVVRPRDGRLGVTDGMGDSIARGVAATAGASGWLILPGDLPLIMPHSLQQVALHLAAQTVVLPYWEDQQGHPVGFRKECRAALETLRGDVGAASVVRAHGNVGAVLELHLDDPGIVVDTDRPEDLSRAEALLVRRNA